MSAHFWPEKRSALATSAKLHVLAQLSTAYEHFAEVEQLAVHEQRHEEATIAHGYCVILLRAMVAEDVNPEPKGLE